jgi:hypothetical protein
MSSVLGLMDQNSVIHLTLSRDLFVWDVISNPPIRTGLHFKSSYVDRDQIARN